MATYKLIQDIEAEDHIIGPLSLRQFIYAILCALSIYMCYLVFMQGAAFLMVLFLPPVIFFGFFAYPFGKDQSTEVWALAKIRFLFKPRRRIWDQTGVKELVTITVPKKIERVLTNGMDQEQVHNRLNALASTIDSRGWAIKNINLDTSSRPLPMSDRLVQPSSIPQDSFASDVSASDDILDASYNPIAQQFTQMIEESTAQHHQNLVNAMNSPQAMLPSIPLPPPPVQAAQSSNWFMNESGISAPVYQQPALSIQPTGAQEATDEERALAARIHAQHEAESIYDNNLRTISPLSAAAPVQPSVDSQQVPTTPDPAVTEEPDPAILSLANNNDLNVSTLAREASKAKGDDILRDEVVISLH